jgi:hypothetical protein
MISMPRRKEVGPRLHNLKWDDSFLTTESMAVEFDKAKMISSMKIGIMIQTSSRRKM